MRVPGSAHDVPQEEVVNLDNEWPIPPLRPEDYSLLLELLGPAGFERALRRDAAYRAAQNGGQPAEGPTERSPRP